MPTNGIDLDKYSISLFIYLIIF